MMHIFPGKLRSRELAESIDRCGIEEIRIRIGQLMVLRRGNEEYYLDLAQRRLIREQTRGYRITREDIREMVTYLSRYSMYAFEEELKNGFITIEGGHRIGIGGQVYMCDGRIAGMSDICFLNLRIARQVKGCAMSAVPHLIENGTPCNTLILSPPGIGKTTFLRDCIRLLSQGTDFARGYRVCVVDERSEIAAAYHGEPQNDVGMRTDVLDRCPRAEGMLMALRAMNPEIIAVDELGAQKDYDAVSRVTYCGCKLLGTIHARDMEELMNKDTMKNWVECELFERYVVLRYHNGVRTYQIYDGHRERIC